MAQAVIGSFDSSFDSDQRSEFLSLWLSAGLPFTVLLLATAVLLLLSGCRPLRVQLAIISRTSSCLQLFWLTVGSYTIILATVAVLILW